MLRKSISISILAMVLFNAPLAKANPVVPYLFSEILVDSSGWSLEIFSSLFGKDIELDTCFLKSNSGQAKIKHCQLINYAFYVITKDSLETELEINPEGDFLQIIGQSGVAMDSLVFGKIPQNGWSICFTGSFYYWDSSPTIGAFNDTDGATGTIKGCFVDSSGAPVSDLTAYWGYRFWPDCYLEVDGAGRFSIDVFATTVTIFVEDVNEWKEYEITVYPGDTVAVTLIFQQSGSSVEQMILSSANDYLLWDNFPNPFNAITRIQYQIPRNDFVELSIYDLTGRLVETLYSGFQQKGKYELLWDAFAEPSGVYIYQLRTSKFVKSKKCLLIR